MVLDVLGSTATKRDAKSYLSRFRSKKPEDVQARSPNLQKSDVGVNLGYLYLPVRAIDQSPLFVQGHDTGQFVDGISGPLHTALVKLRDPQTISDSTLQHVALTLVQLSRLGMSSVVVVDCGSDGDGNNSTLRTLAMQQADRIAAAIEHHDAQGARRLDTVLETSGSNVGLLSSVKVRSGTKVINRKLLLTPLRKGKIPVVAPIAFASASQSLLLLPADEAILALTRDFAGLRPQLIPDADPQAAATNIETMQKEVSLDRIILLDSLGGIPALDNTHQSHVFVNLEQEYEQIKSQISRPHVDEPTAQALPHRSAPNDTASQSSTYNNPMSKFWDTQSSFGNELPAEPPTSGIEKDVSAENKIHLRNLTLLRDTLVILPPSSSGLLTTPETAANSGQYPQDSSPAPGVGTRRQRNPLIHNLLTDKPVFSSSLPADRTQQSIGTEGQRLPLVPSTFFKRGMPVSMIPDPRTHPWNPPRASMTQVWADRVERDNRGNHTQSPPASESMESIGRFHVYKKGLTAHPHTLARVGPDIDHRPSPLPSIQLSDSRIDLPRLIHLIEDSFDRKLDVQHYLSRIDNRIAGIIIAGEYEGGAILTWESPPDNPSAMVPYLDKFAVLKRSQGAGGVADILFTAMVRTCFPDGVCWRSRRDNPVNKWYFERARGTWKIPESNWTMFWTTEGVQMGEGKGVFGHYEGVCRSVEPSWADSKGVVD